MYRKEMMDSVTSRYFTGLETLEPSPFTSFTPKRDFTSTESCASPRSPGTFMEIEQLWEDKWHGVGPVEGAVEHMLQERPSVVANLVSMLSFKRKITSDLASRRKSEGSDGPSTVASSSSGVWRSFKRLISGKKEAEMELGYKPSGSGPCEAFADWPIPRYPDDYEWDD